MPVTNAIEVLRNLSFEIELGPGLTDARSVPGQVVWVRDPTDGSVVCLETNELEYLFSEVES